MAIRYSADAKDIKDQIARLNLVERHIAGGMLSPTMKSMVSLVQKQVVRNLGNAASEHLTAMSGSYSTALTPVNRAITDSMMQGTTVTGNGGMPVGKVSAVSRRRVYLNLIEGGRPAGKFPSYAKLASWAENTLGLDDVSAKAAGRSLAKAIGRKGIRANPTMAKSYEEVRSQVDALASKATDQVIREMAGR